MQIVSYYGVFIDLWSSLINSTVKDMQLFKDKHISSPHWLFPFDYVISLEHSFLDPVM